MVTPQERHRPKVQKVKPIDEEVLFTVPIEAPRRAPLPTHQPSSPPREALGAITNPRETLRVSIYTVPQSHRTSSKVEGRGAGKTGGMGHHRRLGSCNNSLSPCSLSLVSHLLVTPAAKEDARGAPFHRLWAEPAHQIRLTHGLCTIHRRTASETTKTRWKGPISPSPAPLREAVRGNGGGGLET